jgi:hypothetical protein
MRDRPLLFAALGLLYWLAAQGLALGIAIGSEGRLPTLWLSMPLFFLCPIAFIRAFGAATRPLWIDPGLLVVAGVLDVILLRSLFIEREFVLQLWNIYADNRTVMAIWIALWSGWQLLSLASLIRKRRSRIDAAE